MAKTKSSTKLNRGKRQVVAEKIASTVRVLELLGFDYFDYTVSAPKNKREKGNRSPRVVYVEVGKSKPLRIYNSVGGFTWANETDGSPIASVKSIEDLYQFLRETYLRGRNKTQRRPSVTP